MRFSAEIEKIFEVLRENGFAAYAVGGCVRDFLLQKKPADYDIATDARPEEVMEAFSGFRIIPTGMEHGTVTVVSGKTPVEITTFRTEGPYLDNRRPSRVAYAKNIEDDLKRRDFTINAIAYSLSEGFVDVSGGKRDLEERIVRCVGDAGQRFEEDALRLLRALRLAAELGFGIEKNTEAGIHQKKDLLKNISAERINVEFMRLLASGRAGETMRRYRDVFEVFVPEFRDDPDYTVKAGMVDGCPSLSVQLAVLLQGLPGGENIVARLKFDGRTRNEVARLIWYRNKKIEPAKKQIKIWMNIVGADLFFKLVELKSITEDMHVQKNLADEIVGKNECYSLIGLSVKGGDLVRLGIGEGKELGRILQALLFEVILEKSPNEKETLLKRAETLYKSNRRTGA